MKYPVEQFRKTPNMIRRLSPQDQTDEICMAAVSVDGFALKYVHRQTESICFAAIYQYPPALKYVKEKTPLLCEHAVRKVPWTIQFVDEPLLSFELCMLAMNAEPRSIEFIKYPTDRLLEPESKQVHHWAEILKAYQQDDFSEIEGMRQQVLYPLIRTIPLGERYLLDWQVPTNKNRVLLDDLAALAAEMKRLAPRDGFVTTFCDRVGRQLEMTLNYTAHRRAEPGPSRELDTFELGL